MAKPTADEEAKGLRTFFQVFKAMARAARHAAKHHPSQEGIYPIALLMDANGNVICDEQQKPIVTQVPLNVVALEDRKVFFEYTEQMASPKTVASIADVHVATVNRAVKSGDLPKPAQISSRRVAHHMADVRMWLAKRTREGAV
jgi:predicted DNA-binding transcriptional regulator AlpA